MKNGKKNNIRKSFSSVSFILLIITFSFLFTNAIAEEKKIGIRHDGLYQAKHYRANYWTYFRFYDNDKILRTLSKENAKKVGTSILTEDFSTSLRQQNVHTGIYRINASGLQLFFEVPKGKIEFKGTMKEDFLLMNWTSTITEAEGSMGYWFVKGPEYNEVSKSVIDMVAKLHPNEITKTGKPLKETELSKYGHLTEIIELDNHGLYHEILLKNQKGELIAKKIIMRSQYNPNQITGEVIKDSSGSDIYASENQGSHIPKMWICLDKDGNIIKKSGKPIIVKPFGAVQKTEYEIKYKGAFQSGKIMKIYPCSNCASVTAVNNCMFVW